MTVRELIEKLQEYAPNNPVLVYSSPDNHGIEAITEVIEDGDDDLGAYPVLSITQR